MKIKLFDSELKVMELLWEHGELSAKEIAEKTAEQIGWSKTTTYTVLKKCIEKGVLCLTAKDKVRLLPALNIPMDVLTEAVEIIKSVCAEGEE